MFIIAKTQNGREYLYSKKTAVLCKSNEQAKSLADFLNEHNATAQGDFKLKDGENGLYMRLTSTAHNRHTR